MKYIYHDKGLFEEFYRINNVKKEDLDTSSFIICKDDKHLVSFKEKLLSLKDKKFLLIGDYDCDGICSTAITKRLLEKLDIKHNFYIPSRSKDGYGLNMDMVNMAKDNGFEVILSVDNGISAYEAIDLANSYGIKVLIIDHHEYLKEPDCFGYIHPSLLQKDYQNLSAGGLSYLFSTLFYDDTLSLVYGGLATLADMVGVLGFNRYMLKETRKILNEGHIYQINLLNESDEYDYDSLSFNVIPKINSISRMEYNANIMVKYLLADKETCLNTINQINAINEERKALTSKLVKEAGRLIDRERKVAVIISEKFTEGTCGLLANRLVHSSDKPVIVLAKKDGILKGSCRSPEGFNMYEYLCGIKEVFELFGGHEQACGVSIKEENLEKLFEYIDNSSFENKEVVKDAIKVSSDELNYNLFLKLEELKPFGTDLKEPLLVIENVEYIERKLAANKYPKFILNGDVSAISFNTNYANKEFKDMIGHLKKDNFYRNKASFVIEDLR